MLKTNVRWWLPLVIACTTTSTRPDGGTIDAGADAGAGTDAGTDVDAGTVADAGTEADAGAGADAGTEADAGGDLDAGSGQDAGPGPDASTTMSFFVTSVGTGNAGGNLGGLTGADAKCATLIQAATVPASVKAKTWRAYLSTTTVAARTRIGVGPWYSFGGALVAQDLNTLHDAGISYELMLTELGTTVPSNDHDILTGSDADGGVSDPVATCGDWTTNDISWYTQVGHSDWNSPSTAGNPSWNASHLTTCDQAGLQSTAGSGRTYCFAQ
ncbi:MAG: hypothetical protein HYY84_16985 [Deltaproteobacteria bacterium]|nr:hypothetical protein [Deltaproteobacteria bacterium]